MLYQATKGAFPKILVCDVNNFPLPEDISHEQINVLEQLVEEICRLKGADRKIDTTALERRIDQLVYKLYGLTDEEANLVERSIS